jgi:hypothetical protein
MKIGMNAGSDSTGNPVAGASDVVLSCYNFPVRDDLAY